MKKVVVLKSRQKSPYIRSYKALDKRMVLSEEERLHLLFITFRQKTPTSIRGG